MRDLRYRNHNELVNQVLLHLHKHYHVRLWVNNTGALKTATGHFQRYGLKGSADILGVSGDGKFVAIEVKTGTGRLNPSQVSFRDMLTKFNGIYILVHNEIIDEDFIELPRRV